MQKKMSADGKTKEMSENSKDASDDSEDEEDSGNISDASNISDRKSNEQKKPVKDTAAFQFGKKITLTFFFSLSLKKHNRV